MFEYKRIIIIEFLSQSLLPLWLCVLCTLIRSKQELSMGVETDSITKEDIKSSIPKNLCANQAQTFCKIKKFEMKELSLD